MHLHQEVKNYILSFLGSKSLLNINFSHNTHDIVFKVDIVKHTDLSMDNLSTELNDYIPNIIGNHSDTINLDVICWLF